MRLIDVKTLQLREFHHKIPTYAILSHTWGREEVTFQEYLHATEQCSSSNTSVIRRKAGFTKILGACSRARADGLEYLWCDTNCIDKTSSAELSEAINSMYAWYRDSTVCYAYLADVGSSDRPGMVMEEVRMSRWFTRGWTLQELLAPGQVLFFNGNWVFIGDRQRLAETISQATKIHVGALRERDTIRKYSVAQRMSWAADRHTSRQEDIAYCLLGIFGINMPLLYGEGLKAFTRLQEEIIKVSDDQSIFAWDCFGNGRLTETGLFAPSPREFASCGSIVRDIRVAVTPYSMTNIGVSMKLPMIQSVMKNSVLVGLNCCVELDYYKPGGVSQTKSQLRWRSPVWIWLKNAYGSVYLRSSIPASRTLLPTFYPEGADCTVMNFFGMNTYQPSWLGSNVPATSSENRSSASTGFHVIIGFGRIDNETRELEESFSPRHYAVTQLAPRGSPAISHEIISTGGYIVLLSIVWDQQHQHPVLWRHGIFAGANNIPFWAQNNWDVLFRTQSISGSRGINPNERIDCIHKQIQKQLLKPDKRVVEDEAPFIHFEEDLGQDRHGQVKVVVHLTFQEVY